MLGSRDALCDGALELVLSTVDVVSDVVTVTVTASSPPDYLPDSAPVDEIRRMIRESVTDTRTTLEHNAI